jgi:hypothetical protein
MAVKFVERSTLPVAIRGKEGSMSITIASNGQISLSTKAQAIVDTDKVAVGFDNETKQLAICAATPTVIKAVGGEKNLVELKSAKKSKLKYFGGSGILKDARTFGAHLYDYKGSGNQTFAVTPNEKNKCVSFVLPLRMEPKPVVKRVKKVKAVTPVVAPNGGIQTPSGELELTPA